MPSRPRGSGPRPPPAGALAGSDWARSPHASFFRGFASPDDDGSEALEDAGFGGSGLVSDPAELVFCLPDSFGFSDCCFGSFGFSGAGGATGGFGAAASGFAAGGSFSFRVWDAVGGRAA
jgi:hypothetical protein